MGKRVSNGAKTTYAFEKISVAGTAVGFTATQIVKPSTTNGQGRIAEFALVTVETDQIRYRTDGTDPDATTGHLLDPGDALELDNHDDIRRFKAIRVTATATIQVSYS